MITDAIINFFLSPAFYLIEEIGFFSIEIPSFPSNVFDVLIIIIDPLGYFFDIEYICKLMIFMFALDGLNILWALILRIKSFVSLHNFI